MPEKKKLALTNLKVRSFVTELGKDAKKVKAGMTEETGCDLTCEMPCDTDSCAGSCVYTCNQSCGGTCVTCNTCQTDCTCLPLCPPGTEPELSCGMEICFP